MTKYTRTLTVENMNELMLLTKRVRRAAKELSKATKELNNFKLKFNTEDKQND
ncbi:hypothetical protein [Staphylococcus succinus]|uniref:hypothetical protein n=1 Tax=Staphylococcus succinus TaxID=61015 RepID=UPI001C0405C9|nr:hypothetical protein [Staphylococcus succinus]MBU0437017.1 hypothetical protein [Staphylococcus succinus]